jgi:LysR family cyn operon transcriptional activator
MSSTLFDHPNLRAVKLTGEGVIRQATIAWPVGTYRKKAATLMAEYLHKHATDHRL